MATNWPLKIPSVGPPQFQESSGFLKQAVLVKFAIVEKKNSSLLSHDEDAFDKENKAPSPKVEGNFFFLASNVI